MPEEQEIDYEHCANRKCGDNDLNGHCTHPKEAEYSCSIHIPYEQRFDKCTDEPDMDGGTHLWNTSKTRIYEN